MIQRRLSKLFGVTYLPYHQFARKRGSGPDQKPRTPSLAQLLSKDPIKRQQLYTTAKLLRIYKRKQQNYEKLVDHQQPMSTNKRIIWWLAVVFITYKVYTMEAEGGTTYDIRNVKSVEIVTTYGPKFKTHKVILHLKDQFRKVISIANPNVFLEKFQQEQLKAGLGNPPIPVTYSPKPKDRAYDIIDNGLTLALLAAVVIIYRRFSKSIDFGSILKKKTFKRVAPQKDINVKFENVAGMDQAKLQIKQFVEFLKNDSKFKEMGAKLPRGALLTGPPGTGKTMLAKACAGQAKVPFFYVSGSEFIQMFGGLGAARVRQLFKQAKQIAPSIIFIDEIDTIGRNRSGSSSQQHDTTLNQLLVEMDGFKTDKSVIVLAATNRKDVLDTALTRPGRFDRIIQVELPDITGRQDIFKVHLKPLKLNPQQNIEELAKRLATLTPGFSGADIANLCNQAAILAARKHKQFVQPEDFEMASERVMAGLQKKNMMTPEIKKIVSYHEAGHAVVAWFLEGGDPLVKVTIIPRSKGSLGYAQYLPNQSNLKTKQQLLDRVAIMLGGRLSQELFFGKVTTGASDDLQKVYRLTRAMVTMFGMSPVIGNVAYKDEQMTHRYSNKTAKQIDDQMFSIVREAQTKCRNLLKQKSQLISRLAQKLIEKQTLTGDQIQEILGERPFKSESHEKYMEMVHN